MKTKHFLYFSIIGLTMSYCFSADQFSEIRQFRSEMNLLRERIGRNLDSMDSRMEKLKRTFEDPNWKKKQAKPPVQQTNFTPSKPRPSLPPPTSNNRTIPPAMNREVITDTPVQSKKKIVTSNWAFPIIRRISGSVFFNEEGSVNAKPLAEGHLVRSKTLFTVPAQGELVLSFPIKAAIWAGENSRVIVSPQEDGKYEVFLKNGTVSALLDPDVDRTKLPTMLIRTRSGIAEAKGTFYAVTEYKGQAYTAVKKGTVKKDTTPPTKPDFSAYLKKAKQQQVAGKSARSK